MKFRNFIFRCMYCFIGNIFIIVEYQFYGERLFENLLLWERKLHDMYILNLEKVFTSNGERKEACLNVKIQFQF